MKRGAPTFIEKRQKREKRRRIIARASDMLEYFFAHFSSQESGGRTHTGIAESRFAGREAESGERDNYVDRWSGKRRDIRWCKRNALISHRFLKGKNAEKEGGFRCRRHVCNKPINKIILKLKRSNDLLLSVILITHFLFLSFWRASAIVFHF